MNLHRGPYRPFVRWLPETWRIGPWPLWSWGVRIGWAFDFGYLRVGVMRKRQK